MHESEILNALRRARAQAILAATELESIESMDVQRVLDDLRDFTDELSELVLEVGEDGDAE